jgi:UPF0148 protein
MNPCLSSIVNCLISANTPIPIVANMDKTNEGSVKKMAELLRRGATMLAESCPQCGSPLLKVQDDIYCATCDRRIVYAESDEEAETQAVKVLIPQLRETLIRKLSSLTSVLEAENDTEELTKLANLMVLLLQSLHKLESMSS